MAVTSSEILEENHYYPYGLKHAGYDASDASPAHKNQYNGKEWQDELGINYTAMDFRLYDNALGRFIAIDALAEQYHTISPYQFGNNNPIFWADPSGLAALKFESDYEEPDSRFSEWQISHLGRNGMGGGGGGASWGSGFGSSGGGVNVMLYIDSFDKISKIEKTFKKTGWHIIFAVDIVHALLQLKGLFKESSIDNLHFRSHGSSSGTLAIGGVDSDLKRVEFNRNGLSTYIGLEGNVDVLKKEYNFTDKEIDNYKSFIELSNYVKDEGNFFFSSCCVGANEGFTDYIVNSFSIEKTFNFYFNLGNGGTSLDNVSDSIKCNGSNCAFTAEINSYILSKPAGIVKDVILNNNTITPYTIIK